VVEGQAGMEATVELDVLPSNAHAKVTAGVHSRWVALTLTDRMRADEIVSVRLLMSVDEAKRLSAVLVGLAQVAEAL